MPNVRHKIREDIKRCKEAIESNDINMAKSLLEEFETTYRMFWKDLRFTSLMWGERGVILNELKGFLGRLELLYGMDEAVIENMVQPGRYFSINNANTNAINVNINTNLLFQNVIDFVQQNTSISEEERNEILEKIREIQEISNSNDSKVQKWNKLKPIWNWLATKGVDFVIKLIPLIVKVLEEAN